MTVQGRRLLGAGFVPELFTTAAFGLSLVLNLLIDRMAPLMTLDTPGYLAVASWPDCLGQKRVPLYGVVLNAFAHLAGGLGLIPWLQFLLSAVAALVLLRAARRIGLSAIACAALGSAIGLSNIEIIWSRAILPTAPAMACLLLGVAAVLRIAACERTGTGLDFLQAGLFLMLAWLLDPGLLAFIVAMPALVWSLSGLHRWRRGLLLLLCCALPFVSVASLRLALVDDFNIVSFGGFQMSGMAGLMLSPEIAARLPEPEQNLANAILAGRGAQERNGQTIATPENSSGKKSFMSEAAGYFDILARTHDSVLYGVILPQRGGNESWVAFNQRLQKFDIAVIKAAPLDYAAWVLGALGRLAGHLLVMNGIFVLSFVVWCGLVLCGPTRAIAMPWERSLVVLVICFTAGASILTVLVTFPAERYIDMAGLLLPALPLYGLLNRLSWVA